MNVVKPTIVLNVLAVILLAVTAFVRAADEPTASGGTAATEARRWSLQECIAYALEHSPTLAKQKLTVNSQRLQSIIESAAFDVTLNASDTEVHTHNVQTYNSSDVSLTKRFENGFTIRAAADDTRRNGVGHTGNSMSIQISKQILGGGSRQETRYAYEASEIDALRELNTYQRYRRKLVLDVTVAYYAIVKAQASKQVKERALENARNTLAITREREKPLDILTSELKVPENELSVNSAQRQITNGLVNLKVLMGLEAEAPFEIDGAFEYKAEQPNGEADRLFAEDNLETLVNSRLERKKLKMLLDIRDEQSLPDVSVSATHRKYGRGGSFNFTGHEEQVFGINLSWTLGRRAEEARYGIAENNLEKNRHDYFILVQELDSTIGNYLRQLAEYERAVTLQEKICELNRQKEELYRDRWENGEIDILELVRTQTSLEDSLVELNNRKVAYMELLANYRYAIGK